MNIRQTIQALNALAATPPNSAGDLLDDMAEAEYLCLTCEPALAPAAIQHLMARFLRAREAQN